MASLTERWAARLSPVALFRLWVKREPYPWQEQAMLSRLSSSPAARESWTLTRQGGKSTTAATLVAWEAEFGSPGGLVLLCGPTEQTSTEGSMRMTKLALKAMGSEVVEESMTRLVLRNGSRILALSAAEEGARGHTADLICIDESARTESTLWQAIAPETSASRGRIICLSSAWFKTGWYWDVVNTEGNGWLKRQVTADELPAGALDIEQARKDFVGSDREFRREFYCEWQDSGEAVFDDDMIDAAFSYHDEKGVVAP